ncbi:24190_t:CDS:10 [Cetraspora pellucida]|uniref:24190_t:CDS:1 n=1 Tax=Cetraspora pellucida TaxID=1433469 RepID=A0A9N9F101_9GLOM|nr:24190_t:CDS:10 [Cetraspora pellucida]
MIYRSNNSKAFVSFLQNTYRSVRSAHKKVMSEIELSQIPTLKYLYENGSIKPRSSRKSKSQAIPSYSYNETFNEKISLIQADITRLKVDAIVNAANESLLGGGGECWDLDGCRTGDAKITKGYELPAKHVIHTVGPIGEKEGLLRSAYERSYEVMTENNIKSIAFSNISTGVYGYPRYPAGRVALETTRKWLEDHKNLEEVDRIIFCVFEDENKIAYEELLPLYFPPLPDSNKLVEDIIKLDEDVNKLDDEPKKLISSDESKLDELENGEKQDNETCEKIDSNKHEEDAIKHDNEPKKLISSDESKSDELENGEKQENETGEKEDNKQTEIKKALEQEFPNHEIYLSKVHKAIAKFYCEKRKDISNDAASLYKNLLRKKEEDPCCDIILNNNIAKTNCYDMVLSLFLCVDNHGLSWLVRCALMNNESADSYRWDLAISEEYEKFYAMHCIFHISQNLSRNLEVQLGQQYTEFIKNFYMARNLLIPNIFEHKWAQLTENLMKLSEALETSINEESNKTKYIYWKTQISLMSFVIMLLQALFPKVDKALSRFLIPMMLKVQHIENFLFKPELDTTQFIEDNKDVMQVILCSPVAAFHITHIHKRWYNDIHSSLQKEPYYVAMRFSKNYLQYQLAELMRDNTNKLFTPIADLRNKRKEDINITQRAVRFCWHNILKKLQDLLTKLQEDVLVDSSDNNDDKTCNNDNNDSDNNKDDKKNNPLTEISL